MHKCSCGKPIVEYRQFTFTFKEPLIRVSIEAPWCSACDEFLLNDAYYQAGYQLLAIKAITEGHRNIEVLCLGLIAANLTIDQLCQSTDTEMYVIETLKERNWQALLTHLTDLISPKQYSLAS